MDTFLNAYMTDKVFLSKLRNTDISIGYPIKDMKMYNSFDDLIGNDIFQ